AREPGPRRAPHHARHRADEDVAGRVHAVRAPRDRGHRESDAGRRHQAPMKKLVIALAAACAFSAHAQYPNKPVQVIISFTPGSATDIVGRIVTAKLAEYWGQPVVNDNRSGAGGSIGSAVVAKAAPD